eukprot:2987830-Prymnesium_polylepis.1
MNFFSDQDIATLFSMYDQQKVGVTQAQCREALNAIGLEEQRRRCQRAAVAPGGGEPLAWGRGSRAERSQRIVQRAACVAGATPRDCAACCAGALRRHGAARSEHADVGSVPSARRAALPTLALLLSSRGPMFGHARCLNCVRGCEGPSLGV